jgi:hypothetical protein
MLWSRETGPTTMISYSFIFRSSSVKVTKTGYSAASSAAESV